MQKLEEKNTQFRIKQLDIMQNNAELLVPLREWAKSIKLLHP